MYSFYTVDYDISNIQAIITFRGFKINKMTQTDTFEGKNADVTRLGKPISLNLQTWFT